VANNQLLTDIKFEIENEILEAAPDAIYVAEGRQRRYFDQGKLLGLSQKILEEGQHTPGLCFVNENGLHQLIFGERRLRACALAGLPFRYQLTRELPNSYALAVIEFSENIAREDLSWREKADAKAALHALFQERYGVARPGPGSGGHSLRDTAAYLKESLGNVSEDIELAEFARAVPAVAKATNRSEARKLVEKIKLEVQRDVMLEQARDRAEKTRCEVLIDPGGIPTTSEEFDKQIVYLDERVHQGDMMTLLGSTPSPHVVLFDPPWGVDFDTVSQNSASQNSYEDTVEAFQKQLLPWLTALYEHMQPDSHLYMFFGIINHAFAYDTLERVGFATNRMPLFWHKLGAHRTRQPELWPGRCYEAIAFARKGNRPLVRRGQPDIIPTKAPTATMKGCHPSAKHPDIYRDLLLRSCEPGNVVLDPMCGSGMSGVAVRSLDKELALDWHLIELDGSFRDLAVFNLARGYEFLVGDTAQPEEAEPLPSDFRELAPGSPEWKRYWDANPEEQSEMLAWRTQAKS
jgi:hypothetical protein